MKVINPSTGKPQSRGYSRKSDPTGIGVLARSHNNLFARIIALEKAVKIAEEALVDCADAMSMRQETNIEEYDTVTEKARRALDEIKQALKDK